MKKFLLIVVIAIMGKVIKANDNIYNLMMAPGTLSYNSVTLLWDKQYTSGSTMYEIRLNGKVIATTEKTNYTISNLKQHTSYTVGFSVKSVKHRIKSSVIKFKTPVQGTVYNILAYGAKAQAGYINTKAIQKAIDACTLGGTVYIPQGTFESGAVFFKK